MSRPSDREYSLKRRVKELEEQNEKLQKELKALRKSNDKEAPAPKKVKAVVKPCPDCGAETKETKLPHATMKLCVAQCGWREVK